MDPGGIINIISKQPSVKPGKLRRHLRRQFAGQNSPLGQDVSSPPP